MNHFLLYWYTVFVQAKKEEGGLLNHSLPQQIRRHFDIVLIASGIIMKKTSNSMTSVPLKPLKVGGKYRSAEIPCFMEKENSYAKFLI